MSIRAKMMWVVLPLLVVALLTTGGAAFLVATNAVTRVAQEFLNFKAFEIERYAEGQWKLIVDNGVSEQPSFRRAAQEGVASFARSIVRTDTELIAAVESDGTLAFHTAPLELRPEERARVRELAADGRRSFLTITLGGVDRVARGFPFAPFDWYLLVSEQRRVFYSDVNTIGLLTAATVGGAVVLCVAALLLLSRRLTKPLAATVTSMERIIADNDLSARVPVEYRDETGRLAATFNSMTEGLEQAYEQIKSFAYQAVVSQKRESKIRNIFQKYVPQELIDRFFANPESMLVGENRELAILFSDIRGFTTISESLAPSDLVSALNRYFSRQVDVIMDRNGIVDKYIGDAIMAFFGAPVSHQDDVDQALHAGLEMERAARAFAEEQRAAGLPEFKVGIGLTYGTVTVGNIGTDKKMDYTVIGDLVNLASRLEGLTKLYGQKLLLSEHIKAASRETFDWRLLDSVAVKGKSEGVRIYTAAAELDDNERDAWQLHNSGMDAYYDRRFEEAAALFDRVSELMPADQPSRLLAQRCRRFQADPPGAEWSGVEVMTSK